MKIIQNTVKSIMFVIALCIFAQGSFAFAPMTTHAGLTQEVVSFFEAGAGEMFTDDDTELIVQGAIDEDNPSTRALNHFYDPIHNIGINNYRTSLNWANDDLSGNEFTWRKGIEAYAEGDERTAMLTLGHLLHLIEDASVPDHTRNDPHIGHGAGGLYTGTSPLEDWGEEHKDRTTLRGLGKTLHDGGTQMNDCYDIRNCFQYIASYSNGNFFSPDSIGSTNFNGPNITESDDKYAYGIDQFSRKRSKLYLYISVDGKAMPNLVNRSDFSVISEYFDRIEPQVISVGARVIDLYMTDAKFARAEYLRKQKDAQQKAVAEQVALNAKMQNAGFFAQLSFGLRELFVTTPSAALTNGGQKLALAGEGFLRGYTTIFGEGVHSIQLIAESANRGGDALAQSTQEVVTQKVTEATVYTQRAVQTTQNDAEHLAELVRALVGARKVLLAIEETNQSRNISTQGATPEVLGTSTAKEFLAGPGAANLPEVRIDYGFPQGSVPPPEASVVATPPPPPPPPPAPALPEADTTAPDAPSVTTPTSFDFATTSVVFAGTAEASSTVTLIMFDGATTTALLFDVEADGLWNFDTIVPLGTTTLSFTATDEVGNVSSSTDIEIHVVLPVTLPPLPPAIPWPYGENSLIVSEVAWSGTGASSSDEWLEIYNQTGSPIPLDGLTILTSDGNVTIPLTGTIPGETYLVIAANADLFTNYTPNIVADFGSLLNDGGAHLKLVCGPLLNPTIVNEVPFCTDWCNVGAVGGTSMTRVWWAVGANSWDEWGNGVSWYTGTTDRDGNPVLGTPGAGGPPPV